MWPGERDLSIHEQEQKSPSVNDQRGRRIGGI